MTTYDPAKAGDVAAAIRDYFDLNVKQPYQAKDLKVQHDNQSAKTAGIETGKPWIRLSVIRGTAEQVDMGNVKRYRTPGVMMAAIYVPKEKGDKDALAIADFIVPLFRSLTVGGIVVFRTPSPGSGYLDEGQWRVDVTCPFYSDYLA